MIESDISDPSLLPRLEYLLCDDMTFLQLEQGAAFEWLPDFRRQRHACDQHHIKRCAFDEHACSRDLRPQFQMALPPQHPQARWLNNTGPLRAPIGMDQQATWTSPEKVEGFSDSLSKSGERDDKETDRAETRFR